MRIGVVGLGLIGGSVAYAARNAGHRVWGFDTQAATVRAAAGAGFDIAASVAELIDTDVVISAVPLPILPSLLPQLADYRGILTDVTSVKRPVVELVERHCPRVRFIPGHPMSGAETSGFAVADPDLFTDRGWVLCLEPGAELADWLRVAELVCGWRSRVVATTAAEHDRAVAGISHLPHLLATALATNAEDPLAATLAAGSFSDGTRVAATRPELVAAMCGGNADAVTAAVDATMARLAAVRTALSGPDPIPAVERWLRDGNAARLAWPPQPGPAEVVPATAATLLASGRRGEWIESVDLTEDSITLRRITTSMA